jgi:hypothetical protein
MNFLIVFRLLKFCSAYLSRSFLSDRLVFSGSSDFSLPGTVYFFQSIRKLS